MAKRSSRRPARFAAAARSDARLESTPAGQTTMTPRKPSSTLAALREQRPRREVARRIRGGFIAGWMLATARVQNSGAIGA
jgi:hypothetical protein